MRDIYGRPLTPGVNVDRVDVAAGLACARDIGYGDPQSQMVAEYALVRHARGEEDGAQRTIRGHISLTSWYVILAHAITAAERNAS